jgi:hypothetical protein
MSPDEVIAAPPRTVPKTSSGKIRRSAARALYESGQLSAKGRALWWQLARLAVSSFGVRTRRAWHQVVEYAYAAYWWSLLVTLAVLVWLLVLLLPRHNWRQAMIHRAARAFLWLTGSVPHVEAEAWPSEKGVILISNHSSYLDSLVVAAVVPGRLSFVAKEEPPAQRVATFLRRIDTRLRAAPTPPAGLKTLSDSSRLSDRANASSRFPKEHSRACRAFSASSSGRSSSRRRLACPSCQSRSAEHARFCAAANGSRAAAEFVCISAALAPTARTSMRPCACVMARAQMLQRSGEPDLAYEKVELEVPAPA